MSDNWIIVVPENAKLVPSPDAQQKAIDLFRSIAPHADEVKAEVTEEVRFIDCGANLEKITCPECRKELDIEWWQDAMDEEADAGFPLKRSVLACCKAKLSLADLHYDWPQAFARFSVEAMNPQIGDLSDEQMHAFELALGCRVRKVLQHL